MHTVWHATPYTLFSIFKVDGLRLKGCSIIYFQYFYIGKMIFFMRSSFDLVSRFQNVTILLLLQFSCLNLLQAKCRIVCSDECQACCSMLCSFGLKILSLYVSDLHVFLSISLAKKILFHF